MHRMLPGGRCSGWQLSAFGAVRHRRRGGSASQVARSGVIAALASAGAAFAVPGAAHAVCSVLSHHPCTPYVASVLRRHPFTPYSCGVFGGPCSPQVVLLGGELPVLRITGHDGPSDPLDRDHRLEHLQDVAQTLSNCLELPPGDAAVAGMEVAVKLAFKRDGGLMPVQRFTYATRDASESVKLAYHAAVVEMLRRCTPLPVSDRLGDAIAGHPLIVAVKDVRGLPSAVRHDGADAPRTDVPKADVPKTDVPAAPKADTPGADRP